MKEKRASNKLKQKQLETKYLQEQTKKMEDKLSELKKQIQQQKKMRTELNLESTVTRWQKATKAPQGPLKSYAKQILEEQKQAYQQFGINQKKITGSKAFQGVLKHIKQQKQIEEDRNPTKIATFFKKPEVQQQEIERKTVLQDNFFKAKMDVKKLIKQKTLEDFLQQNFILQYLSKFKQEGIIDLQGLRYIDRQKLNEMGVKAGHQVKIIKKIKQEFDKLLAGKYQQKKVQKPSQKVQSGYGEGDVTSYSQPQPIKTQEISNIQLQSQINKPQQYQQNLEQEEQDVVIITAPMQQFSLQVNQTPKVNCYECYKIVTIFQWHYDQKYFCSQDCMQHFMSRLKKSCPACNKTFIKTEGYHEEGLWFCSLGCCPNREEIEQMFFQWRRNGV